MELVCFRTRSPYDHVPRTLDILRKMDFEMQRLVVDPEGDRFHVTIGFRQRGALSTRTFIERLLQAAGLDLCQAREDLHLSLGS